MEQGYRTLGDSPQQCLGFITVKRSIAMVQYADGKEPSLGKISSSVLSLNVYTN